MKVGDKQWKEYLEDECNFCRHKRGSHNDVMMCSDCYDENDDYEHHLFIVKNEKSSQNLKDVSP